MPRAESPKSARPTLLLLMACVVVAAVDLAWFRTFIGRRRSPFGFEPMGLDFGVVPMASLLLILLGYAAPRRLQIGPFLAGFLSTGLAVQLVYVGVCILKPALVSVPVMRLYEATASESAEAAFDSYVRKYLPRVPFSFGHIGWVTILLTIPQFLFASLVGLLAMRWYRPPARPPTSGVYSSEPPGDWPPGS